MAISIKSFGYRYSSVVFFKKKNLLANRFSSNGSYKFSKFYKIFGCGANSSAKSYIVTAYSYVSSGFFIQIVSKFPKFRYLLDFQIKSYKNLIKKPYKKLLTFRVNPYLGVTKKPAEVRMGKGKGSKISHYVFPMRSGFFMILGSRRANPKISDLRFQNKLNQYLAKLPFNFLFHRGGFQHYLFKIKVILNYLKF